MPISVAIPELELNANFSASLFGIKASTAIPFSRIHNSEDCAIKFKEMLAQGFKGKPTSQKITCAVCGEALPYSELASAYVLGGELAVFTKQEITAIKKQFDGIYLFGLADNTTIPEHNKGSTYGIGLPSKATQTDKTLYASMLAFMLDNQFSLVGTYNARNSQNACRVFAGKTYGTPALYLQVLQLSDNASEFIAQAVKPIASEGDIKELKDGTQALEVKAQRSMRCLADIEFPESAKERVEQAIEEKIRTGKITILPKPKAIAIANPFLQKIVVQAK